MHFIETLYIISAVIAILAAYPQLRQLIRVRESDEFNTSTWVTWLITQCVTLTYVVSLGNRLMVIVNIAWVSFYLAMTLLIFYYSPSSRARRRRTKQGLQPDIESVSE